MADIPNAKYTVRLTQNTWANGELDATQATPTYNGTAVSRWHPATNKVGWHVKLTPPGSSRRHTIKFSSGQYNSKNTPQIQGGKVKGFPQGPSLDPQDTWTANEGGPGVEPAAPDVT